MAKLERTWLEPIMLGALCFSCLAHAGGRSMKEPLTLQLRETAQLAAGLTVKFTSLSVEEIAESPQNPKAYPAGSGVSVTLELREGAGAVERVTLSLLSPGYTSKPQLTWRGYHLTLLETADEVRKPKITLRVEAMFTGAERAAINRLIKTRKAGLAFAFKVTALTPSFPILDMPQGYGVWTLRGEVYEVLAGSLTEPVDAPFETSAELYFGPALSRPVGLWVNEEPAVNSVWVVLASAPTGSAASLLAGKGERVLVVVAREKLAEQRR